jgi:mannosyltransferase OCH1-like enzyme
MHPDWEYRLWTDDNLPPLRNREAFDRSPTWNQKSNVLRYELLWQYGGVYVDADCEALRPLDPLLEGTDLFAGEEGSPTIPGLIATGVIGCTPRHRCMRLLLDGIEVDRPGESWEISGPLYLTRTVEKQRIPIRLYPSHYFYPVHHTERRPLYFGLSHRAPRLAESYFLHHWATTTHAFERWPRRLARRLRYELEGRLRSRAK